MFENRVKELDDQVKSLIDAAPSVVASDPSVVAAEPPHTDPNDEVEVEDELARNNARNSFRRIQVPRDLADKLYNAGFPTWESLAEVDDATTAGLQQQFPQFRSLVQRARKKQGERQAKQ